jgi:hypothetical protein
MCRFCVCLCILQIFLPTHSTYSICQDTKNRITPFLGKWKGHSVTKRSGVYGSTIAEADTVVLHEMNENGQLIQVFDILISNNCCYIGILKLHLNKVLIVLNDGKFIWTK